MRMVSAPFGILVQDLHGHTAKLSVEEEALAIGKSWTSRLIAIQILLCHFIRSLPPFSW